MWPSCPHAVSTRPCRHYGCRYHLWWDQARGLERPAGLGIEARALANFRERALSGELGPSCALDVAAEGEHTYAEVGEMLGISRERVRQLEAAAIDKIAGARRPDGGFDLQRIARSSAAQEPERAAEIAAAAAG